MLSTRTFGDFVTAVLGRPLNQEQAACVDGAADAPVLIIAGPGTGKTTVMVLRALRHLLVDGIPPEHILITTFTKKAAQEVRTRWLDWGLPLIEAARQHPDMQSPADQAWLSTVDLNHCLTGTLDSICEEMLGEYRPAGTVTPILVEGFPANQMLLRAGLSTNYYAQKAPLDEYLASYTFEGEAPRTLADMVKTARPILDRFVHDRIDLAMYRQSVEHGVAKETLAASFDAYCADLGQRSQLDFALLEQTFLEWIIQGRLDPVVLGLQAILVDEYQDTNPLQEAIYFELARRSGAALSVVGDDDQSLYRFRGATVELFTNFVGRLQAATGLQARTEYLTRNYRSTPEIISFFNRFVSSDTAFAGARIIPPKPPIAPHRPASGLPVLGMFRESAEVLARDLSAFLEGIFRRGGVRITLPGNGHADLAGGVIGGDFGDAVLLSHSVQEFGRAFMGNPPKAKFPFLMREELRQRGVSVFNPRGQALADQPSVSVLLGLLLECIDRSNAAKPAGIITPDLALTNVVRDRFLAWRQAAATFVATQPAPGGLQDFLDAWADRRSQTGELWPDDWPVLELCFKLIAWMPGFRHDPEHQVWLEAISRAAAQARLFSPYGGTIRNRAPHDERSRGSVIRDILRPIAEGLVDVDEELIPSVPRDRFSLMTIHQAKGLEFPLVIVDVSSGFATNHAKTAHFRFPSQPSSVARLEDDLAAFTNVGSARVARGAMDRTFDDLIRLYYVAYSRPQTALLLVGHEKTLATASTVKNVAAGWGRDGTWSWHDRAGTRSTFANNLPLVQV